MKIDNLCRWCKNKTGSASRTCKAFVCQLKTAEWKRPIDISADYKTEADMDKAE